MSDQIQTENLYGSTAITSGELTESELALLNNTAIIRDGDDVIEVTPEGDEEGEPEVDEDGNPVVTDGDEEGEPEVKPVGEQVSIEDIDKGMKTHQKAFAEVLTKAEQAGIDTEAAMVEYYEKGGLSEATYAKLAEAGLPRSIIDSMISGSEAQQQVYDTKVFELFGTRDEYAAITNHIKVSDWETAEAFNKAYGEGDLKTVAAIVKGMKASFTTKFGTANKRIQGKQGTAAGKEPAVKPFADSKEMTTAMKDPRYGREAKYTKEVEARVAVSN